MKKKFSLLVSFILIFILTLPGCNSTRYAPTMTSPQPLETVQIVNTTTLPLPTATVTLPSPIMEATLWSYPTPINIFDYPDQVTDGRLVLTIKEVNTVCHKVNEHIEIRFMFGNLTGDVMRLADQFIIAHNRHGAGGNIIPLIATTNGENLYTPLDGAMIDDFPSPPDDYVTIQPNQNFETIVDYHFPGTLLASTSDEAENVVTPSPGPYFLRFVYLNSEQSMSTWQGGIGSNRIEICIVY